MKSMLAILLLVIPFVKGCTEANSFTAIYVGDGVDGFANANEACASPVFTGSVGYAFCGAGPGSESEPVPDPAINFFVDGTIIGNFAVGSTVTIEGDPSGLVQLPSFGFSYLSPVCPFQGCPNEIKLYFQAELNTTTVNGLVIGDRFGFLKVVRIQISVLFVRWSAK
jgi:hypothetical protein